MDTLTEMGTDLTKGGSIPTEIGTNLQVLRKYHLFLSLYNQRLKLNTIQLVTPGGNHNCLMTNDVQGRGLVHSFINIWYCRRIGEGGGGQGAAPHHSFPDICFTSWGFSIMVRMHLV